MTQEPPAACCEAVSYFPSVNPPKGKAAHNLQGKELPKRKLTLKRVQDDGHEKADADRRQHGDQKEKVQFMKLDFFFITSGMSPRRNI